MIFLLLSILSSTIILILFKTFEKLNIPIFYPIVINYITAAFLGLLLDSSNARISKLWSNPWIFYAILIGILLIGMFYIIGLATQKVGISVTTISGRMSMAIPILFSFLYYHESIDLAKIIGIILACIAVFLALLGKNSPSNVKAKLLYILIPLLLFIGMGSIDTLIKYCQQEYVSDEYSSFFAATLFAFSGIIGIIISLFQPANLKNFLNPKIIISGILLGSANFGSIYFFLLLLNSDILESSVVFSMNNIGIVILSILSAKILFREKLSIINWTGVFLSIVAIFILAFHDKIYL